MAKYNEQFKLQIVKQYLSGAVGYERLSHEHDVGRTLIRRWVASYRQHARWRYVWRLMPWTAAGVVIGYFAMSRIDEHQARLLIGTIVSQATECLSRSSSTLTSQRGPTRSRLPRGDVDAGA